MGDSSWASKLPPGLRRIVTHRFAKLMGMSVVCVGITKIITVFTTAWAARCLGPVSVGISAMIGATLAQLNLFNGGTLDGLTIRRYKNLKSPEERQQYAVEITNHRLFLGVGLSVVGLIIWFCAGLDHTWTLGVLAAIPVLILTSAIPMWVIAAEEKSHLRYVINVVNSLVMAGIFVAFFRPGQAPGSDVVVAAIAAAIAYLIATSYALKWKNPFPINLKYLRTLLKNLKEGRWLFLTGFVFYAYQFMDLPLIGYLRPLTEVGTYRVAYNLTNPIQEIYAIMVLFLFPRMVEWQKLGGAEVWKRQKHLALVFSGGLAIAGLGAFFLMPLVIKWLYGPAFVEAGYPAVLLLLSKGVGCIGGLFSLGLWAQSEDRRVFLVYLPSAIITLILGFVLIPRFGILAAALVSLLSQTLVCLALFLTARASHQTKCPVATKPPAQV